jgi:hypothetical protein
MDTISLPISFRQGSFEKLSENSDEYYAFILALIMQIEPGELPLTPSFGCASPIFGDNEIANLALNAVQFVPEVTLATINVAPSDSGQTKVDVAFFRNEEQ